MKNLNNLTQGPGNGPVTWLITKDFGVCNDCQNATPEQIREIKSLGFTAAFSLHDDDGVKYYHGYSKPLQDVDGFEPLDDFGMPNAGCTDIRYRDSEGFYKSL